MACPPARLAHRGLLHRVRAALAARRPAGRRARRAPRAGAAADPQRRRPCEDGDPGGDRARPRALPRHPLPLRPAPHRLRSDPGDPQAPAAQGHERARHAGPDDDRRDPARPRLVRSRRQRRHGQDGALAAGRGRPRAGRSGLHRHHLPAAGAGGAAPGADRHAPDRRAAVLPLHRHADAAHPPPGRAPARAVPADPLRRLDALRLRG